MSEHGITAYELAQLKDLGHENLQRHKSFRVENLPDALTTAYTINPTLLKDLTLKC